MRREDRAEGGSTGQTGFPSLVCRSGSALNSSLPFEGSSVPMLTAINAFFTAAGKKRIPAFQFKRKRIGH